MLNQCLRCFSLKRSLILVNHVQIKAAPKIVSHRRFATVSRDVSTSRRSTRRTNPSSSTDKSWWTDPDLWGVITAVSGWTMSLAAMLDSVRDGPEVISTNMTSVLLVYSSLFLRWALVVKPRNLLLASCHLANVCAQSNQMRRAIQYKLENGKEDEVMEMAKKAGSLGGMLALAVANGTKMQAYLMRYSKSFNARLQEAITSEAGIFYVHFWAPMSKWLISGASLVDIHRPTDQISLPQYMALTSCGILHARYALLVIPTNYMLCSVNLALFVSSAWHLGRKIKADYIDEPSPRNRTVIRRRTSWVLDGVQKVDEN